MANDSFANLFPVHQGKPVVSCGRFFAVIYFWTWTNLFHFDLRGRNQERVWADQWRLGSDLYGQHWAFGNCHGLRGDACG